MQGIDRGWLHLTPIIELCLSIRRYTTEELVSFQCEYVITARFSLAVPEYKRDTLDAEITQLELRSYISEYL
ncbi:hypothetical protein PEX1_044430 [Penicillium expansum]|uniref:Uncharacterized protein n=1 Tax=Penicillium expansum TaxID=27334 RepID=A0A0A2I2A1_PENEN|nr:hypothetical protein PEX2_008970 [Penicillium expansum]KGO36618.1 hypothetical protein PEX1_044430 [Penicillium expansum]KGO37005.1 hypothetical protein PEXP_008050 [Penicillium expansum]KGO51330.1 hypothetical protein PEX2_008970 [Penicillium expansum]